MSIFFTILHIELAVVAGSDYAAVGDVNDVLKVLALVKIAVGRLVKADAPLIPA